MLTVTSKYVRQSTSVEFYNDEAFNTYRNTNYIETGKLVQQSDTISADGLTRTVVNDWTTRADFIAFKEDATAAAYFDARRRFCESTASVQTHEFEFVPSAADPGSDAERDAAPAV